MNRYAAIIPCYMNFRDFPVDTQMCNFSIKSCTYRAKFDESFSFQSKALQSKKKKCKHEFNSNEKIQFVSVSFPVDEVILSWQHQPSIERLQLPQHTCRLYAKTATFVAPLARHLFLNSTEEKIPAECNHSLRFKFNIKRQFDRI